MYTADQICWFSLEVGFLTRRRRRDRNQTQKLPSGQTHHLDFSHLTYSQRQVSTTHGSCLTWARHSQHTQFMRGAGCCGRWKRGCPKQCPLMAHPTLLQLQPGAVIILSSPSDLWQGMTSASTTNRVLKRKALADSFHMKFIQVALFI